MSSIVFYDNNRVVTSSRNIDDDSRLTEIYLSVVKEMAIKYGIEFDAS